ncbi:MAG: DUF2190 family protein [Phycisphaerae bacterium]
MPAIFVQDGTSVDYTPGSAVIGGDVVIQGELVGVAKVDIPANKLGALSVAGVFDFPKATGVGTAITTGALTYWNTGAQQATTTAAGNKLIGKCVRAAADADATVRVRMSQ